MISSSPILQDSDWCDHQWFELKKLNKRRSFYNMKGEEIQCVDNKWGILLKCANCNEQKELWEDEHE